MKWDETQYNSSHLNIAGIIKAEVFWTSDYNKLDRPSGYKWRANGLEGSILYRSMDQAKQACETFIERRLNMALEELKG